MILVNIIMIKINPLEFKNQEDKILLKIVIQIMITNKNLKHKNPEEKAKNNLKVAWILMI